MKNQSKNVQFGQINETLVSLFLPNAKLFFIKNLIYLFLFSFFNHLTLMIFLIRPVN